MATQTYNLPGAASPNQVNVAKGGLINSARKPKPKKQRKQNKGK